MQVLGERVTKLQDEIRAIVAKEQAKPQRVKYTTLQAFDQNGEDYIAAIADIGTRPEWQFFMHLLECGAISAAKSGTKEHQCQAIGWLEGFDLVNAEMERKIQQYRKMVTVQNEPQEDISL